jgi:geranylgeranyl reductase family protein
MTRFDVAVIGGGPAGASAARRLALRGAAVALFERRRMPRYKACAGALSRTAQASLDFALPPDLIDAEVHGARAHIRGAVVNVRRERPLAVLVTRSRFDHFLFSKAEEVGAKVFWEDVRALEVRRDGVVLQTPGAEYTAPCAIICEGANFHLSRAVRRPDRPSERGFCLAADVPVASPDPYGDLDGKIDIYFGEAGTGYGWVFHHGSYYAVGLGELCSRFADRLATFRRFVAERGLRLDGVPIRGHYLPCGGLARRVVADRLLLAGDAAGWIDPFQGEGIAYAIRSGQIAAETALAAADGGDFSRRSLAAYAEVCQEAFGRDLRAARTIARIAHAWPGLLVRSLPATEGVMRQYMAVVSAEMSYREFLRWTLTRIPGFWLRTSLGFRPAQAG